MLITELIKTFTSPPKQFLTRCPRSALDLDSNYNIHVVKLNEIQSSSIAMISKQTLQYNADSKYLVCNHNEY